MKVGFSVYVEVDLAKLDKKYDTELMTIAMKDAMEQVIGSIRKVPGVIRASSEIVVKSEYESKP